MQCKFCNGEKVVKNGKVKDKQLYRCKECKHQFLDNGSFVGMRTKSEVISCALNLYFDGLSTWKIQRQIEKIFQVDVSVTTVWKWVMKYSDLVNEYTKTLTPILSGKYHHDETELKIGGEDRFFWETIDKDARYLIAHLLTESRTSEDAIKVFKQALDKQRPETIYTDGSFAYDEAFKKVFFTRYKDKKVEWVRKVGIKARETHNIIERKHGTLKDRPRPARGLKHDATAKTWLDGYIVNYNYVKPHKSLKDKTPAQAAGIKIEADWGNLIQETTIHANQSKEKVSQ